MEQNKKKPEDLNFEDALGELETIVKDMETGKAPLEDSISAYERGVSLKHHCEKKLKEAQTKIEKISLNESGEITSSPSENES